MATLDPMVRCTSCAWYGKDSELIVTMLSPQTREEPADFQQSCPGCGRDGNWIETIPDDQICEGCGDEYVHADGKNDYHHCLDCLVSAAEYAAEGDR